MPLKRQAADIAVMFGVAVVVIALWQYLPPLLGVPKYIIPVFTDVLAEIPWMVKTENLIPNTISTGITTIVGCVTGSVIGAGCGYLLGMSPLAKRVLSPYILTLQISPKVAFAPLFIMWFGYNIWPKLTVTVLIVFFPILVNTMQAMRTVDRDLVNLARAFNMSRAAIFWKIEFPSSMPSLMAGLRIGATLAVIGVTVGELVAGNVGLGYLIEEGQSNGDTAMVFVAIALLTAIGIILYAAAAALEARVLHYIPRSFD